MSVVPAPMTPDELELRLRQQEVVARFGLLALDLVSTQTLLDQASLAAAEGLQTRLAKVLQFRPATNDFLIVSGLGWHAGVVGHGTLGGGLDSPAGYALHTGQPTLSNHLQSESRFRVPALLAEHGVQSALNVAVGRPNESPFGVLEVDSTRRHEFIPADTAFLQGLANVLAAGLARIKAEEAKDSLLRDKDLLMREVHHRVANSLQLVRTMLDLQSRGESDDIRSRLEGASARIMSIAAVHRRLYEGGSVAEADAAPYLKGLVDDMRDLLEDASSNRAILLDVEPMVLAADNLTPLGLVITELVTNAMKYGDGTVVVTVRRVAAGVTVLVEDEGPGFGPAPEPGARRGLGMRLVGSLAKGVASEAVQIDRTVPHGRILVTLTV